MQKVRLVVSFCHFLTPIFSHASRRYAWEAGGKAALIRGEGGDDTGIKFF
jgi:hypothetical protein